MGVWLFRKFDSAKYEMSAFGEGIPTIISDWVLLA
jgi:hypothetical protein